MKTAAILFLLPFIGRAQINKTENFTGHVYAFAHSNKDFTNTIIDTITNQWRVLKINSADSLIVIGWEMGDTSSLYYMAYKIVKIYNSKNLDQNTHLKNKFTNYLTFDIDNYPLLIVMSLNKSHCFLYYYWSSISKSFLKSEKIMLTKTEGTGSKMQGQKAMH